MRPRRHHPDRVGQVDAKTNFVPQRLIADRAMHDDTSWRFEDREIHMSRRSALFAALYPRALELIARWPCTKANSCAPFAMADSLE